MFSQSSSQGLWRYFWEQYLLRYYNGLYLYFTFSLIKTKFMNSIIFRNGSGYGAIWFWISLHLVKVWRILPEITGFLNNIFFAVLLLFLTFWYNHWWIFFVSYFSLDWSIETFQWDTRLFDAVIDIVLLSLLLTLKKFYTLFWCFHC